MSAALLDRDRLARVLGMLGSAHDGEALAAARQAERLRAEAGLTWNEIVIPRPAAPPQARQVKSVTDAIRFVLQHGDLLTAWERDFVRSIATQSYPVSPKQIAVLERLMQKAQRAQERAA